MHPADLEQIKIFERYLMRVDWHLLVARYSETRIRRWMELGDLALKQKGDHMQLKHQDEGGDDQSIAPLKAA